MLQKEQPNDKKGRKFDTDMVIFRHGTAEKGEEIGIEVKTLGVGDEKGVKLPSKTLDVGEIDAMKRKYLEKCAKHWDETKKWKFIKVE